MCHTRQTVLQAELDRIQAEAEARSYAVMNRADALAAAHKLCALLNDTPTEPRHNFEPWVCYLAGNKICDINISADADSDILLRRLDELMLPWEDTGITFTDTHDITVTGFPGVHVLVRAEHLAAHQRLAEAA